MLRRLLSLSLFAILLSQTFALPLRAQERSTASANELIDLLYQPEFVATVDVRRLIAETALDLFNNDPATIEKLKTVLRQIEDGTGINPYQIDQFAIGLNVESKKTENGVLAFRTNTSAQALAEKIYQNHVAQAKFSMEKSQVSYRLTKLKYFTGDPEAVVSREEIEMVENNFRENTRLIDEIKANLAKIKTGPASAVLLNDLNGSARQIAAEVDKISLLIKTGADLNELRTRLEKTEKSFQNISLSDPQRTQKIAAAGKEVEQIEKLSLVQLNKVERLQALIQAESQPRFSEPSLQTALNLLSKLPPAEPKKTQALRSVKKQLTEYQNYVKAIFSENDLKDREINYYAMNSSLTSADVSRREETIANRKVLIISTKETYPEAEMNSEKEAAVAIFSDRILVMGELAAIRQTLEQPAAELTNGNKRMSRLIARMPGALAAFALDLQNVELSELGGVIGEQSNAWEVFGEINARPKELTLSVNLEKTDIPLNQQAPVIKKPAPVDSIPIPGVGDASVVTELFQLLGKTITGAEGKITLKFEKQKIARILEDTPRLLSAILKNDSPSKSGKTITGK